MPKFIKERILHQKTAKKCQNEKCSKKRKRAKYETSQNSNFKIKN